MEDVLEIDGNKSYYLNYLRHREGGPAIEWSNGDKSWWLKGHLHRMDGPAIEYVSGYKAWFIHGRELECKTQEEFEKLMTLKAFW